MARLSLSACGVTAARQVDMFARRPRADRARALTNTLLPAAGQQDTFYTCTQDAPKGSSLGTGGRESRRRADSASAAFVAARRLE